MGFLDRLFGREPSEQQRQQQDGRHDAAYGAGSDRYAGGGSLGGAPATSAGPREDERAVAL